MKSITNGIPGPGIRTNAGLTLSGPDGMVENWGSQCELSISRTEVKDDTLYIYCLIEGNDDEEGDDGDEGEDD